MNVANQALQGVTVLDFTQLLQGPYATQMLGDLGADVIKIEKAGSGDLYRSMTFFNQWLPGGESPCFIPWNRNKRSLAINLKAPEAKGIIHRLVEKADIVVENFRPGVMDKLGFGYEDLKAIHPEIIYCSATGWGPDGPYVTRPGQDLLVQGLAGAAMASGKKSDGPVAIGTALSDQLGAMHIVYSVLAALYYRTQTGKGQKIEVNLLQSVLAFEMQDFFTVHNLGRSFERPESGVAHPGNGAPFGIYATADGYISIAMSPWKKIVEAVGDVSLARYDDPQVLFDQRDQVFHELQERMRQRTTDAWLDIMLGLDIWCARVNEQKDVDKDPQVRHLQAFTDVEHPVAGTVKVTNIPFHMSETPGAIRRPSPLRGQHGKEILRELGEGEEMIAAYLADGIITVEEAPATGENNQEGSP
jgi:crotonobetainyl-CoA:carnitine CoA-transferase CaiB-like acyl-CoA transferase